jgi:Caudovirus prohead serine protease
VLDVSTPAGERAYKLLKSGGLSWSIGFTTPEGRRRRRGKVTEVTEVDLVEISLTPVPADPGARTLSVKSAAAAVVEREDRAERDEEFERLRRAHYAEQVRRATEVKEEAPTFVPTPKTRIVYDGRTWSKSFADEPGGATREQVAARDRRLADQRERRRLVHAARAARFAEAPPTVAVCGFRVRADDGVLVE